MPIMQRFRGNRFLGAEVDQREIGVFADFDAAFLEMRKRFATPALVSFAISACEKASFPSQRRARRKQMLTTGNPTPDFEEIRRSFISHGDGE